MAPKPRFRLFGGPNGSGKTYLFNRFKERGIIHTEVYVNADKIEAELREKRSFTFNAYRVRVNDLDLKSHILQSGIFKEKIQDKSFAESIKVVSGVLQIADYVRVNS